MVCVPRGPYVYALGIFIRSCIIGITHIGQDDFIGAGVFSSLPQSNHPREFSKINWMSKLWANNSQVPL